jgi:hypothetical protein
MAVDMLVHMARDIPAHMAHMARDTQVLQVMLRVTAQAATIKEVSQVSPQPTPLAH